MKRSSLFAAMALTSIGQSVYAQPLSDCPSEAYLIQGSVAQLYGVQLATGHYQLLSDEMGTRGKLNAFAFNYHDNYLYAYSQEFSTVVQIGSDYQVSPLKVEGVPDTSFYVGDIAVDENVYYSYRPGAAYGLYRLPLDSEDPGYLQMSKVIDGATLNLNIFDMAFHPFDGAAYSVDRNGELYRIDVSNGSAASLGNVGQAGTFGAVYFDLAGNLYISRNADGFVYRVVVEDPQPQAEFYAAGPSSSNNDGARCAMAPIIDDRDKNVDFGDAPDSYATLLASNGARHGLQGSRVYLGASVDGESDSYLYPLSDNDAGSADEDGVSFITQLAAGETGIAQVTTVGDAYLNAWIDWDQNGEFSSDEQIFSQRALSEGQHSLYYDVPFRALSGATWARFRYSSEPALEANGGTGDGEVEDYLIEITALEQATSYYPSESGWSTLAYEDNWPMVGDYDMNDLVVYYRTAVSTRNNEIVRVQLQGEVVAMGAAYANGFAIHLPGIERADVDEKAIEFIINRKVQASSPLEAGRPEAILVVSDNVTDYITPGEGCKFHRTESGCGSSVQMRFSISVPLLPGIAASELAAPPFDPFIFASPDDQVSGRPGRSLEIHLKNYPPTSAFDQSLLNQGDDMSNSSAGQYFQTPTGMPWALHIGNEWRYPLEYMDIIYAYPAFPEYVKSAGDKAGDWYLDINATLRNTFDN